MLGLFFLVDGGDELGERFFRRSLGGGEGEWLGDLFFFDLLICGGGGDPSDELPEDDSASEPDALGDLPPFRTRGLTDFCFFFLG